MQAQISKISQQNSVQNTQQNQVNNKQQEWVQSKYKITQKYQEKKLIYKSELNYKKQNQKQQSQSKQQQNQQKQQKQKQKQQDQKQKQQNKLNQKQQKKQNKQQKKQKRRGQIKLSQCKGPNSDYYKPSLNYLTIGDGDLSFSLSIIKWLTFKYPKQATRLTVTSYDSFQMMQQLYKKNFTYNFNQLQKFKNVSVFFQIDVNKLQEYKQKIMPNLQQRYDRIIWNFPHAGFPQEEKGDHKGPGFQWEQAFHQRHIQIIAKFFQKAHFYLKPNGLALMSHKTVNPFGLWNIPKIGQNSGFTLIKTIDFNIDQFPGYQNRKGAGKCGGKKFPCDDAKTYVFSIQKQNLSLQKPKSMQELKMIQIQLNQKQ